MKRFLKLSKYRNFGMEKDDVLCLNQDLSKDKIGDLVILIGPNNSGKSNVLDALNSLGGKLSDRDKTTLSFETADLSPKVTFGVSDGSAHLNYAVTLNGTECDAHITDEPTPEFNYDEALKEFEGWIEIFKKYIVDPSGNKFYEIAKGENCKSEAEFIKNVNNFLNFYKNVRRNYGYNSIYFHRGIDGYAQAISEIKKKEGKLKFLVFTSEDDNLSKANEYMERKYGVPFLPQIIPYQDKQIGQNDLETSMDKFDQSSFFQSVFKAIGIEPDYIKNGYAQYNQFHNKASLKKVKKQIDEKIGRLSAEFNRMYFAEKDQYKFSIDLDSESISFSMARGEDEDPIMIQYQSTGFRWFFDLFFNFLSTNKLNPGDIVIMDEPATNLHPEGQRELRRFLKQFAMKNGVTFVIATHMPFLLDPDNYDELRVISCENNRAHIDNLFTAVNNNDPDSLKPIKDSLTIKQNVLYDFDTEVIWVEGITDYNYLTMFKNLLGVKQIAFLPFQGVGKNDKEEESILKSLLAIKFHRSNLLLDGDAAGKAMKAKCKGTAFENAVCLTDAFKSKPSIKEVEDLFSASDRSKYGSLDAKSDQFKKASASSTMKKYCKLTDFDQETIANFKALFDFIVD